MSEEYIPAEDIPNQLVQVSFLFRKGDKFRKKDAIFEVQSTNDNKRTVTLKFAGAFVTQPEGEPE